MPASENPALRLGALLGEAALQMMLAASLRRAARRMDAPHPHPPLHLPPEPDSPAPGT